MHIPEQLKQKILTHCQTAEPFEACGFVILDYQKSHPQFLPCENVALDPENYFEIDADDFVRAEMQGEIVAVVHSHPSGEMKLSIADHQMQDLLQLDFWLVCGGDLQIFPKILPLVGREFIHGKQDCYSIFRDFYFLAGADLPDFERVDEWWENGGNLYLDNLQPQGFEPVSLDEIQLGDVILMQVGADVPNHAGIYLGDQLVLHHSPKRISKRDWSVKVNANWRLTFKFENGDAEIVNYQDYH